MKDFTSVSELGGITPEVVTTFFQIMRAHELAVRPDLDELTLEQVRADLESPDVDLEQSGIWSSDGITVMVATVYVDRAARNVGVDAYGLPSLNASDFMPVFTAGMDFARVTASADLSALAPADLASVDAYQPDPRIWQIQFFCREEDQTYQEFLRLAGLRQVRNFYRMTIELTEEHDRSSQYAGLELVPAITEEVQRELKEVSTTSFGEHWGSVGVVRSFDEWKALREVGPGFTWERAWLVRVDGQSAGLLICTDLLVHESTDYVWTLGVLKEFRGRGIAAWLLRHSFHAARQRGLEKVALNVDAENTTGAVRLYEAVGMHPTEVYVAYRAPVELL